jgi:hypothetical protein
MNIDSNKLEKKKINKNKQHSIIQILYSIN